MKFLLALTLFLVFPFLAWSDEASDEGPRFPNGLFKPGFILKHQRDIDITGSQRERIMKEVSDLQAKMLQLPDGPRKMELILGTVSRINEALSAGQKEKLIGFTETDRLNAANQLFMDPQKVVIQGYEEDAAKEPFITPDGQYLFFNNANDKPGGDCHLFYARRINDVTFKLIGPVKGIDASIRAPEGINSAVPSLDKNGNIYFTSNRSYLRDFNTILHGHFKDGMVAGLAPVEGISRQEFGWFNMDGEISADGKILYYSDNTGDAGHDADAISQIRAATKNADGTFTPLADSEEIFKSINDGSLNYAPSTSADGLELFFTHGLGMGIYVVKRASSSEPFGPAQLAVASGNGFVEAPAIAPDGKHLYYAKKAEDGPYAFDIYVASRK